ncbi:DUF4193 domain-containing protein [Corynebacterium bovis]|uniref:DUF4193 domain-containing protein n=1 Tax=Corynebacterium bovis TaxID=36808 RepID=A0A3R8QLM7_9CORY|nr:DUF4193 domain-containing protein [Corynebacterium bovis]RRO93330.1 hypothetical protein CXF40_00840 [Corynebacterium bovis]RRO95582.1 hypothetical protein CXF32_07300 [Corynebacterium bovis]RRO98542.1 hypothetical protein CXF31_04330 [Corynebacterium bovis]RRQ01169.1 hypothetical protein CXF41_04720 [Corynebacterium bovis]RRQ04757.1 hypothetical protein CXF39_01255 [Corynebacterium bovis]
MATDYDAPRTRTDEQIETDSLEGLKAAEKAEPAVDDTDDGDIVEPFDIPMAELSGEELSGSVIPRQSDEFTCSVCFLVQHRSRIAEDEGDGTSICVDCA